MMICVTTSQSGRVTLKLKRMDPDRVDYEGELSSGSSRWTVSASVALKDGSVAVSSPAESDTPEWLVKHLRATLRAAFRASSTGTPWPRRVSRWRGGPE
jgi:hypothetical protein